MLRQPAQRFRNGRKTMPKVDEKYFCCRCGSEFTPSPGRARRGFLLCLPCNRAWNNARNRKRRALGLSNQSERWTKEVKPSWTKQYQSKGEVKARRAEKQRQYARDPQQRHKHEARWTARRAVLYGRLQRKPCEDCGAAKAEMHHEDYSRPLDVTWLCKPCHRKRHQRAEWERSQ